MTSNTLSFAVLSFVIGFAVLFVPTNPEIPELNICMIFMFFVTFIATILCAIFDK